MTIGADYRWCVSCDRWHVHFPPKHMGAVLPNIVLPPEWQAVVDAASREQTR